MKETIKRESTWDYPDQDGKLTYDEYHVETIETWEWSEDLNKYELVYLEEKETGVYIPYNEADYIRDGAVTIPVQDEEKTTIAIIQSEQGKISYIEEKEINHATFQNWIDAEYSTEDAGLTEVGENEDGEILYESDDFEGQLTFEELANDTTDWYCVRFWDGNNWNTHVFECYDTEEVEIICRHDLEPSPLWYYVYELVFENGMSIIATQSNQSGSLSPYYEKDDEILAMKEQQEMAKESLQEMYEAYNRKQTQAEILSDMMNADNTIPDSAIDEFDENPDATIKKYAK